ncbi:MAG: hypothetical protein ACHQNA_12335 [Acidimicrobiales bacterium]
MADSTATPSQLLRGEFACPRCGNDTLEAVSDGTQTNFLCHECWTCWHIELGYMAPVPVLTCPGCAYKQECMKHRDSRADQIRAREIVDGPDR